MVSAMNGDTTPLRFANTRARLYGADLAFGVNLAPRWRLKGVITAVRGVRKDIDDDLYRVSPDELTLSLGYNPGRWSVALEGSFVAAQDRVSRVNSEQTTAGYSVFKIHGDWQVGARTSVAFGVENILDRKYSLHLAGYNRVAMADVPLGHRLPGPGRGVVLRITSSL